MGNSGINASYMGSLTLPVLTLSLSPCLHSGGLLDLAMSTTRPSLPPSRALLSSRLSKSPQQRGRLPASSSKGGRTARQSASRDKSKEDLKAAVDISQHSSAM